MPMLTPNNLGYGCYEIKISQFISKQETYIHICLMHYSKVTSPEDVHFPVFNMLRFIRTLAVHYVFSNFICIF
jgi:hypothetical protein